MPGKFRDEVRFIFQQIRPGNRIFVGTGCGEPQHLVGSLFDFARQHPKAFLDAELINIVTLGVAPYADERFKDNVRLNSFFISESTRRAVNMAEADYTPIFLSQLPGLIRSGRIPLDVALIQTTLPDREGRMNLGVSVDIVRAAVEKAEIVIAQPNSFMPDVDGDGWISMDDVDFIIAKDEPLQEYIEQPPSDVARKIGSYVSRIVDDCSTIQVGYGSIPNAIVGSLGNKKHLGVHTELFCDAVATLMEEGVVDNSKKSLHPGKSIATFCMGRKETFDFLKRNSGSIEFRSIDYTNNPLVIAQNRKMTAINSALQVDLTGQATAESLGHSFFSGIGGQADFMRGAALAQEGKTILALPSTAQRAETAGSEEGLSRGPVVSRIVPFLSGSDLDQGRHTLCCH